jgi:uncharacterized protein GlcG (DUF336 family)
MKKIFVFACALGLFSATDALAAKCTNLPDEESLREAMRAVAGPAATPETGPVGGLFNGSRMWGAIVNRDGEICSFVTTTSDPTQVWPGSQAIAKAKAYTANAFSLDSLALSTAMLYTFTQPGHSLWSLGQSNLWNPELTASPGASGGKPGQVGGGLIFFGGGVPLYRQGRIIGALGISGDTSCADHEVAKRTRNQLNLNPPGGATADDISYSSLDGANVFTHPLCLNTWRNGSFVGNEAPAVGY